MNTELMNWIEQQGRTAGYRALAEALGVHWQTVQYWARMNRPPAERCLAIEKITGISRYALRPDVYGEPQ